MKLFLSINPLAHDNAFCVIKGKKALAHDDAFCVINFKIFIKNSVFGGIESNLEASFGGNVEYCSGRRDRSGTVEEVESGTQTYWKLTVRERVNKASLQWTR